MLSIRIEQAGAYSYATCIELYIYMLGFFFILRSNAFIFRALLEGKILCC